MIATRTTARAVGAMPASPAIRVALIDDDHILAGALRHWASSQATIDLVATAPSLREFATPPNEVDVVLLDLSLQDGTEPSANVHALVARGYRVLVISVTRDGAAAVATTAAGALGYLTKNTGLDALTSAVTEVAAGRAYYSRELAISWLNDTRPGKPALAEQERAVLIAYSSGMTLKQAARAIGVQPGTAKGYLDRVREKYHDQGRVASTKVDLANRAREDGLTP